MFPSSLLARLNSSCFSLISEMFFFLLLLCLAYVLEVDRFICAAKEKVHTLPYLGIKFYLFDTCDFSVRNRFLPRKKFNLRQFLFRYYTSGTAF